MNQVDPGKSRADLAEMLWRGASLESAKEGLSFLEIDEEDAEEFKMIYDSAKLHLVPPRPRTHLKPDIPQ